MADEVLDPKHIGRILFQKGWGQGAMFDLPSASWARNTVDPQASDNSGVVLQPRRLKAHEQLIVISQDCDIVKGTDAEPFIEALICTSVKGQNYVERIDKNSIRWFVVERSQGLITDAQYRVLIEKKAFLSITPRPWPSSADRLTRFIRWLGRRYSRIPVADELVEHFQWPVEAVFQKIAKDEPKILVLFNEAVHEVRVRQPVRDRPPYDLQLILILRDDSLTAEEDDAIDMVTDLIHESLNSEIIDLDEHIRFTEATMSVRDYRLTRLFNLEYISFDGEEFIGAEPLIDID